MEVLTTSIITCPKCGFEKEEEMSLISCQYFYQCLNCSEMIKPLEGDCCVYCSYGSVKCPPIQKNEQCC